MNLQGVLNGRKRIPCPRDPSHTIWEDSIEKHVNKCRTGARPLPEVAWCLENINISYKKTKTKTIKDRSCSHQNLIRTIEEIYKDIISKEPLETCILESSGVDERLAELGNRKHALQQGSLIGNMDHEGLLKEENIIAEFGCGRAELSRYIARTRTDRLIQQSCPSRYVLIDRSSPRMKFDSKIISDFRDHIKSDGELLTLSPTVERIKMDIKDLLMNKYPMIENNPKIPIVAVSKHLCGCATDLTLSCLKSVTLKGIVIALCCRQICSYATYPEFGREWLSTYGIGENEFQVLCKLTSWAVCGRRKDVNEEEYLEKENIGLKARRIIDYGRLLDVRKRGMKAKIIQYINKEVSLENHALIAVK